MTHTYVFLWLCGLLIGDGRRGVEVDIEEVVKNNLCMGCGTCVALCPTKAIEMTMDLKKGIYAPRISRDKCNDCGICYRACPGHEVDFKQLNLEIFGTEPEDILIGNFSSCYVGHATDHEIRNNSSSGGLVTTSLIFALEEGVIDGALVTRMGENKPLEPEPFIARSKKEIIEAMGSKYCPVPANIALKEILGADGKFAVVGIPCQMHGIRKAEMIDRKLKEKIVLHFGLFCSGTPTFFATEFLFKKFKVKKDNIKRISYRGPGWPGGVGIEFKDGKNLFVPFEKYYHTGFGQYFYPVRCKLCIDPTCEFADISFADAWIPEIMSKDKIGTSIIIPRNERGEKLLQDMASKKVVAIDKVDKSKVLSSQGGLWGIMYRKSDLRARVFGNKRNPVYNTRLLEPTFRTYLSTTLSRVGMFLASKRYLWRPMVLYIYSLKCAESLLSGSGK